MDLRSIKAWCFVTLAAATLLCSSRADTSLDVTRDKALKGIEACKRRNEASSRECKSLNKNIQTLVDVYRQGDKTVLPTLLHFTYLSDFFGEALISDPDGFLIEVSQLPEAQQEAVAYGLAGGMGGMPAQRYQRVRSALMTLSDSSSNYELARKCLVALDTENASLVINYFPPLTFVSRVGDFQLHWYSRELYALGERPLWPPTSENQRAYRITVIPAFSESESATLKVMDDGSSNVSLRTTGRYRRSLAIDKSKTISAKQAADFTDVLNRIQFWQLPTESPHRGFDGAEWILEGVQDGTYHVVVRWCPGKEPFGEAARKLFDLAGRSHIGGC
jgi:hypothetical protein